MCPAYSGSDQRHVNGRESGGKYCLPLPECPQNTSIFAENTTVGVVTLRVSFSLCERGDHLSDVLNFVSVDAVSHPFVDTRGHVAVESLENRR